MRPLSCLACLFVFAAVLRADPVEVTVRSKTPFKDFSLSQVSSGQILQNRQGAAVIPAVEAVQTCFLVKAPLSKATSTLLNWNPAGVAGLDVASHMDLGSISADSFAPALTSFLSKSNGGAWIVKQSKDPQKSELMLTDSEKSALAAATKPDALVKAWSKLLANRFEAFTGKGDFNSLLAAVRQIGPIQFSSPSGGSRYWELSEVSGRGAISEGVTWQDGPRICDGEFFVTSEYTASFDVSTLWPVTIAGKPATLVWRIDSAYSPQFSDLHGAERIASSSLLLSSVKRAIEAIRRRSEK